MKRNTPNNLVSALMILIQTTLAISLLYNSLSMTATVFVVILIFSIFAWSFHWFAPFSCNISRNNRFVGFFVTLFYLVYFILIFVLSNYF
jgi:phosphoglycerol transferase MdoB-like AlkP superfamily enzyme